MGDGWKRDGVGNETANLRRKDIKSEDDQHLEGMDADAANKRDEEFEDVKKLIKGGGEQSKYVQVSIEIGDKIEFVKNLEYVQEYEDNRDLEVRGAQYFEQDRERKNEDDGEQYLFESHDFMWENKK